MASPASRVATATATAGDAGADFADSDFWESQDAGEASGRRRRPWRLHRHRLATETALLAGVGALGVLLDMLLVRLPLLLGRFASPGLAMLLALATYVVLRQHLRQQAALRRSSERMLEQLHRSAHQIECDPGCFPALARELLCAMFEPRETLTLAHRLQDARVLGHGSALAVPIPALQPRDLAPAQAVVLRHARRGRRLFTPQDAHLADGAVDQLRRAAAHHLAVEQGRREERMRLAQDLHDDIGARLLTLMYRAGDPATEDYVRETLHDLKTLTRGLATGSHRLLHALPEWKADLRQRLKDASCELGWHFEIEADLELSMAQWSALTRVLRELVSNAIAHAHATRVEVHGRCSARGDLELAVLDDGCGRDPARWSHGLGLAAVRKRVKQLGGQVRWIERSPHGIECRVAARLGSDG